MKTMDFPAEIIKANPRDRYKILLVIAVIMVIAAIFIQYTQSYFQEIQQLAQQDIDKAIAKLRQTMPYLLMGIALGFLAGAGWWASFSYRIYKSNSFPPPGTWLIKDTQLLQGKPARLRAILSGLLAGVLLVSALLVPGFIWIIFLMLLQK